MKQIISILLLTLVNLATAQVATLSEFKKENQFQFFVVMEVRDFIYELDSEYSLIHWTLDRLRRDSLSEEEKKKIDVSISRVEEARDAWRAEASKIEKKKDTHPNLRIIKFVLDPPEGQKPKLEKQGYLVVRNDDILEFIWDDGLAFYDGILGIKHAEENLGANQTGYATRD